MSTIPEDDMPKILKTQQRILLNNGPRMCLKTMIERGQYTYIDHPSRAGEVEIVPVEQ